MPASIQVIRWRFGWKVNPKKKRDHIGSNSGEHGGCWINDCDCGKPDCPMARFDGRPEVLTLT